LCVCGQKPGNNESNEKTGLERKAAQKKQPRKTPWHDRHKGEKVAVIEKRRARKEKIRP